LDRGDRRRKAVASERAQMIGIELAVAFERIVYVAGRGGL
jgi:hypothetical protein